LETLTPHADLADIAQRLRALLAKPAEVSRFRRGLLLATTVMVSAPVLAILGVSFGAALVASVSVAVPELAALRECLRLQEALDHRVSAGGSDPRGEREAIKVYVAGRFGPVVTNAVRWNRAWGIMPIRLRREAERILRTTPAPSSEQFGRAQAIVEPYLGKTSKTPDSAAREALKHGIPPLLLLFGVYFGAVVFVILPCLIGSLFCRGGALVHALGIAFVNRDGTCSPRWRIAWRNLIAWLPFLLIVPSAKWLTPALGESGSIILALSVSGGLALLSTLLPSRSLQDRLAGTWLVPR
jgi:hypothetical protein